jgi:uncharacterized protein
MMRSKAYWAAWIVGLGIAVIPHLASAGAAEVIPPAPKAYFNDYAGVVSAGTVATLNQTLESFERETSSQILVVIFPKMQSDSSIEDYTVRVAQSWHAGQKGKDNGAVLFVFIENRTMYLQVGYGLEGALPDFTAKQIIENEIKPRFRANDYDGGMKAGVAAILAATKGEYRGTGQTAAGGRRGRSSLGVIPVILFFVLLMLFFSRRRRSLWGMAGWTLGSGGFSGGSWGGGGGYSGGGGGGFSGGGGSFGGGGAGGSW